MADDDELQALHVQLGVEVASVRAELERLSRGAADPRGFWPGVFVGLGIAVLLVGSAALLIGWFFSNFPGG